MYTGNKLVPLDLHVTDKLRQNIIAGDYINFSDLLKHDEEAPAYALSVDDSTGEPRLVLGTAKPKSKNLPFSKWTAAWNIYSMILSQSCNARGVPELTQALSQHFHIVVDMFHKGQDWQYYDRQFRMMKTKGLVEWGKKNFDLAFEARDNRTTNSSPPLLNRRFTTGSAPVSVRVPVGFCRMFHRVGRCQFGDTCRFNHACFQCKDSHPQKVCPTGKKQPFRGNPPFPKQNQQIRGCKTGQKEQSWVVHG